MQIMFATRRPAQGETIAQREQVADWSECVNRIEHLAGLIGGVETLGKGAWLVRDGKGLPFLGSAAQACNGANPKIDYKIFSIEIKSEWPVPK